MRSGALFWLVMALIVGGGTLLVLTDGAGSVFGIPSSSFAGVLYLGVWALVLASVFVGSRFRRAHALRNAAIWLAILVLLLAAYRYRAVFEGWIGISDPLNDGSTQSVKFDSKQEYI